MTSPQLTAILEKSLPPFSMGKKKVAKGDKAGHAFHGNQYQQVGGEGVEGAKKLEGAISDVLRNNNVPYDVQRQFLKADVCKNIADRMGTQFDGQLGITPLDKPIMNVYGERVKPLDQCFTHNDLWSEGQYLDENQEVQTRWTYLGDANDPKVKEYLADGNQQYIDDHLTRGDTAGFAEARMADKETDDQSIRREKVSELIHQWAITANDNRVQSLAIQEVAKEMFGIKTTADWDVPQDTQKEIDDYRSKNDEYLKSFLKAQYDLTQEFLQKNNITSVQVERGFSFRDGEIPDWAKNLFDGKDVAGKQIDVPLRPLSSFTTSPEVADRFADWIPGLAPKLVIQGTVPANQIFSLSSTGFGCFPENEAVVVGGSGTWTVRKATK